MINFQNIDYLKKGNKRQKEAFNVLKSGKILDKLHSFSPVLTGTIPINIDIPESDLDIICYWENKIEFLTELDHLFSAEKNFQLKEITIDHQQTVIANFIYEGFEIEIFGQNLPTSYQNAYRHLIIEHSILNAHGEDFRKEIINLKLQGYKTEPAFAKLLDLKGDPYLSLLDYEITNC